MASNAPFMLSGSFTDEKVKCPVCHTSIPVVVETEVTPGHVRITGGTAFQSNIGFSVNVSPKKVRINHECDIPDKKD